MLCRESNKDWMKGQIASSLPGRLRLRVDGLAFLFDARMDVAGALATIAGVRRVQVTPCTGSVLLEYDQNKLDSAALAECADMVLARYAMPALRAPDRIRAVPDDLPLAPTLDAAAPDALVCGGLLDAAVPALQAHSLRWFDYARDETLALENAELTAEAALPPLLARLPCPLRGSRILILGFGRIGKRLAWKLHTLGAAVTVAARRPEALALARILGLQAEPLGPQLQGLAVYDAVVNTVPAPVICDVQLSAIRPDAALLELASLPGGFCPAAAERAGYLAARGLPGVYAPEAAAAVIRRTIFRELDLEECP